MNNLQLFLRLLKTLERVLTQCNPWSLLLQLSTHLVILILFLKTVIWHLLLLAFHKTPSEHRLHVLVTLSPELLAFRGGIYLPLFNFSDPTFVSQNLCPAVFIHHRKRMGIPSPRPSSISLWFCPLKTSKSHSSDPECRHLTFFDSRGLHSLQI